MSQRHSILMLDGSLHGEGGNTSRVLDRAQARLSGSAEVFRRELARGFKVSELITDLRRADAIVVGTGTYWDSWGSPLQQFLESMTETEGSELWLGKPAAVVVTMHSVGGKGVLSRLQGVLNTYGALIPPMTGIVCSAVNQVALQSGESEIADDLWRPEDLEIVCHNLLEAISGGRNWRSWEVDREGFGGVWFEENA